MGWHNIVLTQHGQLVEALEIVTKNLGRSTAEVGDLDEVCRGLIGVQAAATSALGQIYDSCGPFFPSRRNPPKEVV